MFARSLRIAAAVIVLAAPCAALAQQKLKFAHVYETGEPYHKWAVWAGGEIAKRTQNRYTMDVFPASALGNETQINQSLSLGTVDIIYTGQAFAARTHPPLAIGGAPYMFRDFDHWKKYSQSAVLGELADAYFKKGGNRPIAYTYYGVRHTTANKAIVKPEDMKGLKLRVPDAPLYIMYPKVVGANATPIAFAEVYLALQNGTVDAQENPLTTIEAKKFFEVQKYIILTGHIVDSLATQIAPHLWTKLSDADKQIFMTVTREAAGNATADITKRERELVDEFKKKGLTIIDPDKKSFQDAIVKSVPLESMGYTKADWDKVQAVK
jgi:tripartite ATP-independent transporter DctP family solute receptor